MSRLFRCFTPIHRAKTTPGLTSPQELLDLQRKIEEAKTEAQYRDILALKGLQEARLTDVSLKFKAP